jgi:hypothetical protein
MNSSYSLSYLLLRKVIGVLGILLPVICFTFGIIFGGFPLKDSISQYYHSNVRDVFVGIMATVALFLFVYKGYDKIDKIVCTATGCAGLGLALFPCYVIPAVSTNVSILVINPVISNIIHITCAGLFFTLLALNSLLLFTKTSGEMTDNKKKRNVVYRSCGIAILSILVLVVIIMTPLGNAIQFFNPVFFLEFLMLIAFGISWLVKGEAILKDKE